ncbi:exo-beta-N-acetylmuramidase NamZ domain-containing protein [Candidatus Poribacteria bacterium]
MSQTIKLGLSVLLEEKLDFLGGRSVGLITNATGVNENLEDNISLFCENPDINLKAIFSPEHGLWGAAQDAISISSFQHEGINIPIYSLYGKTRKPTQEMLEGLDALVFDIQDVGVRFYTYISTMATAMETCAEHDLSFFVLDRPNPIGGLRVEGNILEPEFSSFVGYYPIPIRHGMTTGELARMFNEQFQIGAQLDVVTMSGWRRDMWFDDTELQWIMPSPNMPTLTTAIVYPGTCFFEGTNVSEGRGTTRPFELIGAPWIDAHRLADELNQLSLVGVKFRPTCFIPTFAKHKDQRCGGVQVHVLNREEFAPVKTALNMIDTIRRIYPDEFQWRGDDRPFFDLLMGTDKVRKQLSSGESVDNIMDSWTDERLKFLENRSAYLLY